MKIKAKSLVRRVHEWIVKQYVPDDDQPELAQALYNWKHGTSNGDSEE